MSTTQQKVCAESPCPDVTVVTTAEDLRDALEEWHPEQERKKVKVIEIPDGKEIHLDDIAADLPLKIKAHTTLQSTRGARRPGALLRLDDSYETVTAGGAHDGHVFRLTGNRVRIRNLRLRGPSSSTGEYGAVCGLPEGELCPAIVAIQASNSYRALISDNEIFDWPGVAVEVRGNGDEEACRPSTESPEYPVRVVRNYIHHNQRTREGYGVKTNDGGRVLVEGNTFDWNRHAIAGDGSPTSGYDAAYNYVLSGGSHYGGFATYQGSYQQHFDMHGDDNYGDDEDTNDGYGGNAGDVVRIVGNTVHGAQKYGGVLGVREQTRPVYWLRGIPCRQNELRDNVLVHEQTKAVRATNGGRGHVTIFPNQFETDTSWSVAVGDFDRDGRDDLFQATGAAWYYSSGGVTEWRLLQAGRTESIDQLRFGDFDGDGDTDVFTAADGEWRISRGATQPWKHLNTSAFRLGDLRFGDFNGDGRTDAFRANGSRWYYYPGAARTQKPLAGSAYRVDEIRFGNFDGDKRADVFGIEGGHWSVSYDGRSRWHRLNSLLARDLNSLVLADFDGNGRTDIAQSLPGEWRVSWSGTGDWERLRTVSPLGGQDAALSRHWIGEFDSSPGADALRYAPPFSVGAPYEDLYLVRSSGARAPYVIHSRAGMR
jgi:Right handed beta helix region/FG-GAP-like repeat